MAELLHIAQDEPQRGLVTFYWNDGRTTQSTLAEYQAEREAKTTELLDVAEARREALAKLAEIRWEKICEMTYGELVIRSNKDAAQTLTHIGGLIADKIQSRETRRALGQTPPARIKFKIQDGLFLQTTEAELRDLGLALEDHVQACFDHEERLTAQILAASTSRQVMGIDLTQGWP